MTKKRIINDPLYGLIHFPYPIIYEIIEQASFQRLRRIRQMGFASYVYPGATHSRFQHTLGAVYLMHRAIEILRNKGIAISDLEAQGACVAILLHDIGHGPFSHALENVLVKYKHEDMSLVILESLTHLNPEIFSIARQIFTNRYPRPFLSQLVSGHLDVDRMDYLNRDSFYTGVVEGKIGYDRILMMLNVADDKLVVEQKGIYSIEKFLIARRFMYDQVYLHKTCVTIELMLRKLFSEIRVLGQDGKLDAILSTDPLIEFFLEEDHGLDALSSHRLAAFLKFDDHDVWQVIKKAANTTDFSTSFLAKSILNRKLFNIEIISEKPTSDFIEKKRQIIVNKSKFDKVIMKKLTIFASESTSTYSESKDFIRILTKAKQIERFSEMSTYRWNEKPNQKYLVCFPK